MTSQVKIQASRTNGLKGGIKTAEGKSISRWNSLKHGILRQSLAAEEKEVFEEVLTEFIEQLKPFGVVEEILVERLVICYLKLKRVSVAESEHLKALSNPRKVVSKFAKGFEALNISTHTEEVVSEGFTPVLPEGTYDYLGRVYSRYEEAVERRFYKALGELERLQRLRRDEIVPASTLMAEV